jgi:protocatechuate 3,4-dioxygenase beta subunit
MVLLALLFVQEQPSRVASIEGVVFRSGSATPLSRTQLTLTRIAAEPAFSKLNAADAPAIRPVFSNDDGKFSFKDLEPGQYQLMAERNGYTPQAYGQRRTDGPGAVINLAAGQTLKNIAFSMVPAGTVTGRVRDARGEPVAGMHVALMRTIYDDDGRRQLTISREAHTDDRGEYRMFWITPGRYYVRVGKGTYRDGDFRVVAERTFETVYYPGSPDTARAIAVEVQPGAEIGGVDVLLPDPVGHRVSGRVVDGETGKPPKSVSISLYPRQSGPSITDPDNIYNAEYSSSTGTFLIENIAPGAYWLGASSMQELDAPLTANELGEIRTRMGFFKMAFGIDLAAQISIDMPAAEVTNVVLTLSRGTSIPVRLAIEATDPSVIKDVDEIRVQLWPPIFIGLAKESGRFGSDGMSKIEGVLPGEYRVSVGNLPNALYVKEIRYVRTDGLTDLVRIGDQPPDVLNVVLSTSGGEIQGTVVDALSKAVADSEVVLIPNQRQRKDLYRTATTDSNGRFVFRALAPGGYRAFSWHGLEPNSFYDPDVLSQYESQSRSVQVRESSKETTDLTVITVQKP